MPCEKISLPGKDGKPIVGIICYSHRQKKQKKCFYCTELEDYQCDGAIEKKVGKYKSCDRSMCRSCTVRGAGETDWCKDHRSKIVPGTISIGNIKTTTDGIYVGRKVSSTGLVGSPLGNPFKLSSNFAADMVKSRARSPRPRPRFSMPAKETNVPINGPAQLTTRCYTWAGGCDGTFKKAIDSTEKLCPSCRSK